MVQSFLHETQFFLLFPTINTQLQTTNNMKHLYDTITNIPHKTYTHDTHTTHGDVRHTQTSKNNTVIVIGMNVEKLVPIGWLAHIVSCHFIFRHIRNHLVRTILTLMPCLLLSYIGCRDLPQLRMSSFIITSTYWIMSMRIIHLIIFSANDLRTFYSFIFKVFWTLFPVVRCESTDKQWSPIFDFILGSVKMIINHWIVRWLINCEPSENYPRMIMVSIMILTSTFLSDFHISLVRFVTRDRYTLLSINNYPLLSKSLREFWGRRYNRLTSTVFHESIFQPVQSYLSSSTIAALTTFIFSGLLHAHIASVLINDTQSIVSTFTFFLLQGIACCLEKHLVIRLPAPLGWLATYLFLLVTIPLCMAPYTRLGPAYFDLNHPLLFDAQWLPKLPIPKSCLQ